MSNDNQSLHDKNKKLAVRVGIVVVVMIGLSFAFVPLYRLLCQKTGLDGTPKIVTEGPKEVIARTVTVKFDANTAPNLPWYFQPKMRQATVKMGETLKIEYAAKNNGNRTITGTALYNISPDKAAKYFHKMQCFCFNEQVLKPGEEASFPVSFYVDPDMDKDLDAKDVNTITLSYTFFETDTPALDKATEEFYNRDPESATNEAQPHTHGDGEEHGHGEHDNTEHDHNQENQ